MVEGQELPMDKKAREYQQLSDTKLLAKVHGMWQIGSQQERIGESELAKSILNKRSSDKMYLLTHAIWLTNIVLLFLGSIPLAEHLPKEWNFWIRLIGCLVVVYILYGLTVKILKSIKQIKGN